MDNIKIKNKNGNIINMDFRYTNSSDKKLPLLVFCHGFMQWQTVCSRLNLDPATLELR